MRAQTLNLQLTVGSVGLRRLAGVIEAWLRVLIVAWLILLSTVLCAAPVNKGADRTATSEPLGEALRTLATQSNLQILF